MRATEFDGLHLTRGGQSRRHIPQLKESLPDPNQRASKANPTKVGDAKPRVLASSATPSATPRRTPRSPGCQTQ